MRNKNIRWYQKSSMLAYLSSYLVSWLIVLDSSCRNNCTVGMPHVL
jgi:hypothetical protein